MSKIVCLANNVVLDIIFSFKNSNTAITNWMLLMLEFLCVDLHNQLDNIINQC